MEERNTNKLGMAAFKQFSLASIMLFIQIVIFYFSAGYINFRTWFFFSVSFVHYSVSTLVQFKLNSQLLVVRLKLRRAGSKLWDEILMRISNLMILILIPIVAGFDVGKFYRPMLDIWFVPIGFILLAFSTIILNWAMLVNPHFEPTVRIQKDRAHKVISCGPYRIVRHPGYLAGILFVFSMPTMIGSTLSIIPAGIYCLLILVRTFYEDRTLQQELEGYSEYANKVRYRLFPHLW